MTFWPDLPSGVLDRHYLETDPVRMSLGEFEALRECDVRTQGGAPYEAYKCKIRGRWFQVNRQYQFGRPVYFAEKIIIVVQGGTHETSN